MEPSVDVAACEKKVLERKRLEIISAIKLRATNMEQKINGAAVELRGVRFKLQDQSVVAAVEEAMAAFPGSQSDGSRAIGMHESNFSFIRKLILVHRHPAITPEDKAALGSCFEAIERERRIPNRTRDVGTAVVDKYWVRRKANKGDTLKAGLLSGTRFKAQGAPVEAVREAMKAYPVRQEEGARSLGMHKDTFSMIRKLIILSEDDWISREDRSRIEKCLETIDKNRRIADVRSAAKELIDRCWVKKKDPPATLNHRRKRFDQTIMAISESSESTTDMILPRDLKREEVQDTISSLTMSVERINKLIRKMVGGQENP